MNINLSHEDIIALQETTEGDATHNYNNKRKLDGQQKEQKKQTVSFSPHWTCPQSISDSEVEQIESPW